MSKKNFIAPASGARIRSVSTAHPPQRYSQEDILKLYNESNPAIISLFQNSHIKHRYFYLPTPVNGVMPEETHEDLMNKHMSGALALGPQAIELALKPLGLTPQDIDYLCCVSSTGFLCPGITARITKKVGFRENIYRVDILGMGCNAGLNSLQPVVNFTRANPGKWGLLLCVEICSAAYVYDHTMTTAVVNSLFGDGVAAMLVRNDPQDTWKQGPLVLDFESHIIPEAIEAMKFTIDSGKKKLSFFLDRDIPYVLGLNIEKPVQRLLSRHNLKVRDIDHWVVHSGGKKVIDAIEYNLGLTDYDMRHTLNVLENYGNLSSGSFVFSYEQLLKEESVHEGDLCVAVTMGPGVSIETALLTWASV